jgi:nucleoside-diphosphate-sugar epimerase
MSRGYSVQGLDAGFFQDCLIGPAPADPPTSFKDVRDIEVTDVEGFDAVIHLAALSNDPLGELRPELTEEINRDATIRVAELAKGAGVKRFIYASSQSMYGIAALDEELDEEYSEKNPLTAYAKTKWEAEQQIRQMADEEFCVVCFRPSTVFGFSPRQRCDIVFNNLVGAGVFDGVVRVKSDGSPWRPVIHIADVCTALMSGLAAPIDVINGQAFNVGPLEGNYRVKELAEIAAKVSGASDIVYEQTDSPDERTYRVSFLKINTILNPYLNSFTSLASGGSDMVTHWKLHEFERQDFEGKATNRLSCLNSHISSGKLSEETLRWKKR